MSKYNNIVNKHTSQFIVPREMFFEDIPSDIEQKTREELAKGIIVISNKVKNEAIYVLNSNGEVIQVAASSTSEIPGEIMAIINNEVIPELKAYTDDTVASAITEYNTYVIQSGTALYDRLIEYVNEKIGEVEEDAEETKTELENRIEELNNQVIELRNYIDNLKFSDHVLLTEQAYNFLLHEGYVPINEDGEFDEEGEIIYYSDDVYYCIYDPNEVGPTPGGDDAVFSGNTIEMSFEIEDEHTLVFENSTVENEHTLVIGSGSSSGGTTIDGTDAVGDIDENEHAFLVSEIGENNEVII